MYTIEELIQQLEYLISDADRSKDARKTSREIQTLNLNFSHLQRSLGAILPYAARRLGHFGTAQSHIAQALLRIGSGDLITTKAELRKARAALMEADTKLRQAIT